MTVYDYREITLKEDLCLDISRDTDIENPRENDFNRQKAITEKQLIGFHYIVLKKKV